jgi:hypothetical protein
MSTPLDDVERGWVCTELDLGYPDIREVTNNAPIQHGIDDVTAYFGGRVVTASITAVPDGTLPLDDIVSLFGRYTNPGARPELHFTRQSASYDERMLLLRASGWSAPMGVPSKREFQLSWVAPDALIRNAIISVSSAWVGEDDQGGRVYEPPDLAAYGGVDRDYSTVVGSPSVPGAPVSRGDLPVSPLLRIYGPITQPVVRLSGVAPDRTPVQAQVAFGSTLVIGSGEWVDVDCKARTANRNGDPAQSVFSEIEFDATQWPLIYPVPWTNVLELTGSSASPHTLVEARWQDAFLA